MTFDPNIGRWMEDDPIGFEAGDMDLYRFVGNNPTNAVDPTGEDAWILPKAAWKTGIAFFTGEEPPPELRVVAGYVFVNPLGDASQLYKTPARAFWEWVATNQMEAKGRPFAGFLLRHSLQENPEKLVFSDTHFSTIAIRKSKVYKDTIADIVKNAKPGKCEGIVDGVNFAGIQDLDVSIGNGTFRYKLNKVDDDNYEIEVQVYDRYNFEVHIKKYYGKQIMVTGGNNAAWLSQYYMAINGFDWETVWLKEKKGNVE